MKTILKILVIAILTLNLGKNCFSKEIKVSSAFLKISPSPDAEGMGNAACSLILPSSTYFNPSAIFYLKKPSLSLINTQLTYDRKYNFVNYIYPSKKFAIGVSYINFGVEGIEIWTEQEEFFGVTSDKENAYILTFAKNLSKNMSAGINLKYITQKVYNSDLKGNAFDIGILYSGKISCGITLQDISGKVKWSTGARSPLPKNLRGGISYKFLKEKILIASDINKREDEDTSLYFGGEYKITDNLILRIGSSDGRFTAGAGIYFDNLQIDYSYKNTLLGDTQKFKITYLVGKEKPSQEVEVETPQKVEEKILEEKIEERREGIKTIVEVSPSEIKPEHIVEKPEEIILQPPKEPIPLPEPDKLPEREKKEKIEIKEEVIIPEQMLAEIEKEKEVKEIAPQKIKIADYLTKRAIYIMEKGETFQQLAGRVYKDETKHFQLIVDNPHALIKVDLQPGDKIILRIRNKIKIYTIMPTDDIYKIAKKLYGEESKFIEILKQNPHIIVYSKKRQPVSVPRR